MALTANLFAGCGNKAGGDSIGTGNETSSTAQQTAESGNADQNADQKERIRGRVCGLFLRKRDQNAVYTT